MDNFTFSNPVKVIFGRNTENKVGRETSGYSKKILLHYGSGSIKTSGLYDRVTGSLREAGVEFIELPGVKANPSVSLVREGIRICRQNGLDFILAVGGGSVIDSAKGIAAGVPYDGDVWDFYSGKARVKQALPVGTVLTIPAAGSETSASSVITNEDGLLKRGAESLLLFPRFSILNPELAFTLPPYQVACGVADIMSHLMERYFTSSRNVDLTDRLIEAGLKTVIHNAPVVMRQPDHYDAWAEIMWTGSVAHNNLLNTGRVGDWATHLIEHEISGIYDLAHGAGLALIFPAWMKHVYRHDLPRFVQFATRVWNVDQDHFDPEATALAGIARLEEFWGSLGLHTRISACGISNDRFDEMASKCTNDGKESVGNFVKLSREDVLQIYRMAY